ncbi:unnamed protein product [Cuscuta campestris]|uniref:Uncharacterized protein n=1 Tax=Cuscuta campestris TaxID=132261 RepID=A0A484MKW2_9ASTE|nr:unnamed protein product [Cuscuta campestris]
MESNRNGRCIFPLSSLQIGDLQCYLSHRSIFLAPESKKIYILVDNRPWLQDLISHPAHLWQLMVTKSRVSPFANTRGLKEKRESGDGQAKQESNAGNSEEVKRWFSLLDAAALSRKSALFPVKKLKISLISSNLNKTLYGFIVFEVAWRDVRGMNYFNELQTDTSFALEAKFMRRWEFDSMTQAASCLHSWFSGTDVEKSTLKEYLNPMTGEEFYDAEVNFSRTSVIYSNDDTADDFGSDVKYSVCTSKSCSLPPETIKISAISSSPSTSNRPYKRRNTLKDGLGMFSEDTCCGITGVPVPSQQPYSSDCENDIVEATNLTLDSAISIAHGCAP